MDIKTKITTLAILAAATCAAAAAQRKVTVCMADATLPVEVLEVSKATTSVMFAAIGVKLDWHCSQSGPQEAIVISLVMGNSPNRNPHELAHALPYEGTHIVIFYDSVRRVKPRKVPVVLAHVMVHEITHILQGFPRHADSGIMKAHWDDNDFLEMAWKPLPFTAADVDLIQHGLNARYARSLVASNHVQ